MAAHNAKHILHEEWNPDHMETIEEYRHTEAREGLHETKESPYFASLTNSMK